MMPRIKYTHLGDRAVPRTAQANFPGESTVLFRIELLENVNRAVQEQGWYAQPNLIIQFDASNSRLDEAVRNALLTERTYDYRAWLNATTVAKTHTKQQYNIEYYGDPDSGDLDSGWIDVAIKLIDGNAYTLTIETMPSIELMATEDQQLGAPPFFYCPDLLLVKRIDRTLIGQAVAAIINDIPRYGILCGGQLNSCGT